MKSSSPARFYILLLFGCCALSSLSSAQTVANKQSVLSEARNAYYNLRSEGLSTFECSVIPNWELTLQKEMQQNSEGARAGIQTLNQLHFTISLSTDGSVRVTHNELKGQNEETMKGLAQVYRGMEQMASGFFDTWKVFMLSSPFPEVSSEYQLEVAGPQYKLSYREDLTDVVTRMDRDFVISNMKISAPEFDSSIQPNFSRTPKGYVLSGYAARYQSQKQEEATQLKVLIDYQDVQGLKTLQTLNLSGSYGGSPFAIELAFSDCKVTKKK